MAACEITTKPIFPLLPAGCDDPTTLDLSLVLPLIHKAFVILSWAAEVAAVFLLLYAGFLYITSAGDEAKAGNAKKLISSVVIGILIIMFARWSLYLLIKGISAHPADIISDLPEL